MSQFEIPNLAETTAPHDEPVDDLTIADESFLDAAEYVAGLAGRIDTDPQSFFEQAQHAIMAADSRLWQPNGGLGSYGADYYFDVAADSMTSEKFPTTAFREMMLSEVLGGTAAHPMLSTEMAVGTTTGYIGFLASSIRQQLGHHPSQFSHRRNTTPISEYRQPRGLVFDFPSMSSVAVSGRSQFAESVRYSGRLDGQTLRDAGRRFWTNLTGAQLELLRRIRSGGSYDEIEDLITQTDALIGQRSNARAVTLQPADEPEPLTMGYILEEGQQRLVYYIGKESFYAQGD